MASASGDGSRGAEGSEVVRERELLVQHLLLPDDQLQQLLELQRQIAQGVDLSDLAEAYSICPSAEKGGMIGWIARGRTEPSFEEVAFNSPVGAVARCKTRHGWHLVQVLKERPCALLAQVSVEEFARRIKDEYCRPRVQEAQDESEGRRPVQLLDVREEREIALASLPGFTPLPLSQFGQWAATVGEDLDQNMDTYIMCHHGIRSQQMAEWLKSQGFTRLFNISGGIDAYSVKVDNSVPRY